MKAAPRTRQGRVLLAAPRGCCAGVDRAVDTVEAALDRYGPPVYVRKQIVHNSHTIARLAQAGVVFVDEVDEVPEGSLVVFSAHGVAPSVHTDARERRLTAIDATCPLVSKVHREARRFAARDYDIVLIGHQDHDEVIGTTGHAPDRVHLVTSVDDIPGLTIRDESKVVWLSQTTLSVDETQTMVTALKERFPALSSPPSDDICYATQNRQTAVKEIAAHADVVLVIGSSNSANSRQLVTAARTAGAPAAYLIDGAADIDDTWLTDAVTVGLTSGASAPDTLVTNVLNHLKTHGFTTVEVCRAVEEDVRFALPAQLRPTTPA